MKNLLQKLDKALGAHPVVSIHDQDAGRAAQPTEDDALYEFEFDITDSVQYNLQYSGATGTLRRLIVNELSFV